MYFRQFLLLSGGLCLIIVAAREVYHVRRGNCASAESIVASYWHGAGLSFVGLFFIVDALHGYFPESSLLSTSSVLLVTAAVVSAIMTWKGGKLRTWRNKSD